MHIALSARALAPHRGQESGLTSLRGSLTFFCTPVCVVLSSVGCRFPRRFCRVLAVGLLAFGAAAPDGPRPATPLASRTVSRVDFAYTRYLPTPCLRPNALRSSVMVLARVKPFLW